MVHLVSLGSSWSPETQPTNFVLQILNFVHLAFQWIKTAFGVMFLARCDSN